jgi:hypothetical protein
MISQQVKELPMFRSQLSSLIVVGSLLALSGCNEDPLTPEDTEQLVWEVHDIVSNGTVQLTFSADAYLVAVGGLVDIGIRISDAEFGSEYGWLIRGGECGSDGPLLTADPSAFPTVVIGPNGEGSVAKSTVGFLEGTEEFHVEVYLDPQTEINLVGCGQMILIEGLPDF